ncbi:AlbA family DNA-binding domain-containing protein [Arthrobacter sp. KK5.5]|uniref:AlbA family DNA-binding domain-containing protein n=1 Tax=Arthrobacter sp. KK5.5 TaxID=3373084 RepID=UPI003EE7C53A
MVGKLLTKRGNISVFDEGLYWEFDGKVRKSPDGDQIYVHIDDLRKISTADLKAILRRMNDLELQTTLVVVTAYKGDIDLDYVEISGISLELRNNDLIMNVDSYEDIPENPRPHTNPGSRVAPLLVRKRMWMLEFQEDFDDSGISWHIRLAVGFHTRGRTAASLVEDGLGIQALMMASSGQLTPATLADLVRAGHAQTLLGQPENQWLEVKRQHYDLGTDYGKVRLAQTVSQFANSDSGGVVVVGLESKKRDGVDTIHAVTPMKHDPNIRRKYVQAISNRIYPPPDRLVIEVVAADTGDLVLIEVPSQPEELKPFLVHGSIIDGRTQGTFISIVQRRDDEAASSHPAAIHSMLAAGRAFLRRGHFPDGI